MTFRSPKLLKAAKGRPCVLCGSIGTTVAAHSNSLAHGRGFAHKSADFMVAYLCQRCHDDCDGRSGGLSKEEKRELWLSAWVKTVAIWFEEEIVSVRNERSADPKAKLVRCVQAKCIGCGAKRDIYSYEIAAGDHPCCGQCGMLMIAERAFA